MPVRGGHPLAGKTGTVNNETDVWFIGYTPTYVTGVWMGNPLRKETLGAGMTGGHGAVPYFNAFMIPFMKDKPRETFPDPPPMPSDIKALAERNKREELEKLSEADAKGRLAVGPSATADTAVSPACYHRIKRSRRRKQTAPHPRLIRQNRTTQSSSGRTPNRKRPNQNPNLPNQPAKNAKARRGTDSSNTAV